MTGDKSKLLSIKPKDGGRVTFGGDQSGKIAGIGEIGNNEGPLIKDVYLVEGLCHNLLSVSQSTDKGNLVIFDSDECFIIKKDLVSINDLKNKALFRAPRDGKDRKSTRLNSSHSGESRMPSSA